MDIWKHYLQTDKKALPNFFLLSSSFNESNRSHVQSDWLSISYLRIMLF